MTVNSDVKVANLNADKIDGKDSTDFAPRAVEGWHEVGAANQPDFQNGWINYGANLSTAAFYKDPYGVVHLKGVVKGGTVSRTIFELPCGYAPSQDEAHVVLSNETVGRVTIAVTNICSNGQTMGWVYAAPPSDSAWISLDGITFRAAGS